MDEIGGVRPSGVDRIEIFREKTLLLRRLQDRGLPAADVLFLPLAEASAGIARFTRKVKSLSPGLIIIATTTTPDAPSCAEADFVVRLPEEADRLRSILMEAGSPASEVGQRRQLEQMLVSAQLKMQCVLDQLAEGVAVVDPGCSITRVNRKLMDLLGRPQESAPADGSSAGAAVSESPDASGFLGRPCYEALWNLAAPCPNCPRTTGERSLQETRIVEAGGRTMQIDASASLMLDAGGHTIGVLETVRDASPRLKLEERLIESEKMKAIALIAAGMAHELRNPLTVINTTAECGQQLTADDDSRESFEVIINAVRSADKVIRDLLQFARPAPQYLQPVAVGELIEVSMNMISARARKQGVQVELHLANSLPSVNADRGKLQQALLNFMLNAIEAMQSGGVLSLQAAPRNGAVDITIADTGCGMSKDEMARVFEPFFTTKRGGVGLGMAVSRKIIDAHQGQVMIDSAKGRGTTVKISLPARPAVERAAIEIA